MIFTQERMTYTLGLLLAVLTGSILSGCQASDINPTTFSTQQVLHQETWGIYELDLKSQEVNLIYNTSNKIYTSALRLDNSGDKLVFAQSANDDSDISMEIYSISTDGKNLTRLTENNYMDVYPVWSPDGTHIAFLSKRDNDIDIYIMDANGANPRKLYDSGTNDADIDWVDSNIVFTSQFAIWKMNTDGSHPTQLTDQHQKGQWGNANLPIGDYDPRLSPDGNTIVFERLEDTEKPNGGYNFFTVNIDGTAERRLTENYYAQGLASWSHSEDRLVYVVAAIDGEGRYDIFTMNPDGSDNRNITPDHFPDDFLCHSPMFSFDDSKIFFIGQWWE